MDEGRYWPLCTQEREAGLENNIRKAKVQRKMKASVTVEYPKGLVAFWIARSMRNN